jgi:hypothetical protein
MLKPYTDVLISVMIHGCSYIRTNIVTFTEFLSYPSKKVLVILGSETKGLKHEIPLKSHTD